MSIFMIQTVYEHAKTWYCEAEDVEAAKALYESGELELGHIAAQEHFDSKLNAIVPLEGRLSKDMMAKVIHVTMVEGEPDAADQ